MHVFWVGRVIAGVDVRFVWVCGGGQEGGGVGGAGFVEGGGGPSGAAPRVNRGGERWAEKLVDQRTGKIPLAQNAVSKKML